MFNAGFRLPYYGVEQDWMDIEYDHSQRKNRSNLLPDRLHVRRALNDLPTQGRLFGVVAINTGKEAKAARDLQRETGEFLKIQVSRDRFVANKAYQSLRDAVRWSLNYYATRQRLREQNKVEASQPKGPPEEKIGRASSLLRKISSSYPDDETVVALEEEFDKLAESFAKEGESEDASKTMLGSLASAGMAALALKRESRKEMRRARQLFRRLRRLGMEMDEPKLLEIADQADARVDRVEIARRVFAPLLDSDDRDEIESLAAAEDLLQVIENVRSLLSGMEIVSRVRNLQKYRKKGIFF